MTLAQSDQILGRENSNAALSKVKPDKLILC